MGFQTPPDRRAVVTVTTDGYETRVPKERRVFRGLCVVTCPCAGVARMLSFLSARHLLQCTAASVDPRLSQHGASRWQMLY